MEKKMDQADWNRIKLIGMASNLRKRVKPSQRFMRFLVRSIRLFKSMMPLKLFIKLMRFERSSSNFKELSPQGLFSFYLKGSIMKIDLPISDVKEICEFFWYKYQEEHEKYCELQEVLSGHCDEYDAEKHHELYMHFYNYSKYLSRFYHWSDMLHYIVMEEDSRE